MTDEAERLRQQLHLERAQRVEQDLERELVDRGVSRDAARGYAQNNRDRITVDADGDVSLRLPSGGVAQGERGVTELARAGYLTIMRDTPRDAEVEADALRRTANRVGNNF